jgi:hypothetical protein
MSNEARDAIDSAANRHRTLHLKTRNPANEKKKAARFPMAALNCADPRAQP